MASAVRRLASLSMARGCARIDAGPDTAKIGSADRVQVHHARLIAVIGYEKRIHTAWTRFGPRIQIPAPEHTNNFLYPRRARRCNLGGAAQGG